MDNSDVGNAFPTAGEHDGLRVSVAAAEVENRLENGGGEGGFRERRKRGRPRKQFGEIQPVFRAVAEGSGGPQKRGRGRPRGSGKWQTLAASLGVSSGQTIGGSRDGATSRARPGDRPAPSLGGSNFTPYIIEIQAGENIVERIWSFSQRTNDSICILSASGAISVAEIFLPASPGRILKYEGHYTIVCLNGSHTYDDRRNVRTCLLSVQLANSDGGFYGGAVAGRLISHGPTQVIISAFRQELRQQASIRPPTITAPNPNNENGRIAAAPLQVQNGRISESEMREEEEDEEGREEEEEGPIFNGSSFQPQSNDV